jgi:hypothetical protein
VIDKMKLVGSRTSTIWGFPGIILGRWSLPVSAVSPTPRLRNIPIKLSQAFTWLGGGENTSGVTTFNKTLHDLLHTPFVRKVYHRPLRDIARLIVFLIPHIPLAGILKDA